MTPQTATATDTGMELPSDGLPNQPSGDTSMTTPSSELSLGPVSHIGYHSILSGVTHYDLSCLHTYHAPRIRASLSQGRQECIARNRHNLSLAHPAPLDDILGACEAKGTLGVVSAADVVTWRGIVTK